MSDSQSANAVDDRLKDWCRAQIERRLKQNGPPEDVVVKVGGERYHRVGAGCVGEPPEYSSVEFESAIRTGFSPCKRCFE